MITVAGKTNVSAYFYVVGDAGHATPGEPVTGLLFSDIETGGSASYARQGAARVDLTLVTLASASAAHTDGGFILVDDANMPGVYRCDFPDAAFAAGVDEVTLQIVIAPANNAVAAPIKASLFPAGWESALSDIESSLVIVKSDLVVTESNTIVIESDTLALSAAVSDVESSLVVVKSDLVVVTTDVASLSTKQDSDMVVLDASHTKTQSDVALTTTPLSDIESSLVVVKSDLVVATADIASLSTKQDSDMVVVAAAHTKTQSDVALTTTPLSDIESSLVIVTSDLVVAIADIAALSTKQDSDMVVVAAAHTKTQSDIALTTGPLSDIESSLVIVKSDLVVATSDLAALETEVVTATGEPAQGAPGVSVSRGTKIDFLYKAWRNRSNQTATTYQLFADDATTVDHKATISDDGTTFESSEIATGP